MFNDLITTPGAEKLFFNMFDKDFFSKSTLEKVRMPIDIVEKEDSVVLSANLAGFKKDDISISLSNGYLTIQAEKKESETTDEKSRYITRESASYVKRSGFIGKHISEEDLSAMFKDGILTITLKKKEPKELKADIPIE